MENSAQKPASVSLTLGGRKDYFKTLHLQIKPHTQKLSGALSELHVSTCSEASAGQLVPLLSSSSDFAGTRVQLKLRDVATHLEIYYLSSGSHHLK